MHSSLASCKVNSLGLEMLLGEGHLFGAVHPSKTRTQPRRKSNHMGVTQMLLFLPTQLDFSNWELL